MRHRSGHRKLNRNPAQRRALLRGLAGQLIKHGRILTTLEKAKELRKVVEPLITRAKVDSVFNRRFVSSYIYEKDIVKKLFIDTKENYLKRPGGYTRILRLGFRPGDHASRAVIELVHMLEQESQKPKDSHTSSENTVSLENSELVENAALKEDSSLKSEAPQT
jgi:large subunit ribosomal protein L17